MAWECLTEEYKLDKSRIYASYFGGDESSPADEEARKIWEKYLPPERVLPFGKEDNFWEMGATGPCGPCVVRLLCMCTTLMCLLFKSFFKIFCFFEK